MPVTGHHLPRWGAVASLATALCGIASSYALVHPPRYEPDGSQLTYEALYLLTVLAQIITVLAVRHLHGQPERRWGRLGEIAAWLTLTGLGLVAIKQTLAVLTKLLTISGADWLAPALMAPGTILSLVGLPLIGVAVIRARTMPRWFGWTFALNLPVSILLISLLLPELSAAIASSIFPIAIGWGLWTARRESPDPGVGALSERRSGNRS